MKENISNIIKAVIDYNKGDARRINHLLKVYSFAKTIGELEKLDSEIQEILEITAVLHDIGIHESERKYNSSSGYYQQIEGPEIAREILEKNYYAKKVIDRVCYLIAHHHTYSNIIGLDYQILVEADFLVNIFEDNMKNNVIEKIRGKIFKTDTGIHLLNSIYGLS